MFHIVGTIIVNNRKNVSTLLDINMLMQSLKYKQLITSYK